MKLFSKKSEEPKAELPPLKFPEFPKEESDIPSYESGISADEAASIKQAVNQPRLEIPIRKPLTPVRPVAPPPVEAPHIEEPVYEERPQQPSPYEERSTEDLQKRGQTLFVKMERYKEAVAKMDHIKDRINEAEKILTKLDDLKRQEDEELARWHEDLGTIKEKILSIDKSLFE